MKLQEFKQQAGVEKLEFRPCFNNKKVQRCVTQLGTLFMGEDFNAKSKVVDVEMRFDDDGNQVYWLTNRPVSSTL